MPKRVLIVGGVAGGMSCATRLKRLDEEAEITVFEKGPDVSFANCGMPYHIGGVIEDREKLLVQTPDKLHSRYGIDVHTLHEVNSINREKKTVKATNLANGEAKEEPFDALVLSTGAAPFVPDMPGADGPNVFVLNDLADMDKINLATAGAKKTVVVGAGFIGLELAENLRRRGLEVDVVELMDQIIPPMDGEMTQPVVQELKINGVNLILGDSVTAVEEDRVKLKSGREIECDFVCMSIGVRPTSRLAKDAGLELGARGHIKVNDNMVTSDPDIYAVGDVVEVKDFITGEPTAVPLAGPANRQGRIAADNICGRKSQYRGTQGTAIVKVFNLAVAMTGLSEKRLKSGEKKYYRAYLHPMQHPGYYPGAKPVNIKLLFSPEGQIYGAQAVGSDGVDSIINVIATAIRAGQTVEDLEHMELAYSPQWGSAKHPINMIGFVASNILKGDVKVFEADAIDENLFLLDVRTKDETEAATIPGATVIPVDELRKRVDELPKDREIGLYCAVGLRGYLAYRFLVQKGFKVCNLNGGFRTWCMYNLKEDDASSALSCACDESCRGGVDMAENMTESETITLDVCGLQCPGPIKKVKDAVEKMSEGDVLKVISTDPGFAADIPMWCKRTGNRLLEVKPDGDNYIARIAKGNGAGVKAGPVIAGGSQAETKNGKTIICFSNDLDKVLASFIIANGAAAMGSDVTIFFTFWGLNVLRKEKPPKVKKGFLDRMFGWMMPKGPKKLKLSKMNMAGMGTAMMKHVMKSKNVMTLQELIDSAKEAGVRLVACSMSMDVMGIKKEELIDGVEIAGVGHYLGTADEANVNLFI